MAVLASGTALGQAVLLLSAPILTRLYSAEQYGVLAMFISIITIVGVSSTLRFELVIPLPRREDTALNILALTLICVAVVTGLSGLVMALVWPSFVPDNAVPGMNLMPGLIPLGILCVGAYVAFSHLAVRRRGFGLIARTKLLQSLGQTAIQIGSAFTPWASIGLLAGSLAGQGAGTGIVLRGYWRADRQRLSAIRWKRIWTLARHHWHFPVYSLPASIANTASQQAPALLIVWLFDLKIAGLFFLAQRLSMMPVNLLSTALSQAYHRELVEHKKSPGEIGRIVSVPTMLISGLIIGPATFAAMAAPLAMGPIFGAEWVEAGLYLMWLTPWVAATLIFGAMTPVVSVLGYQKLGLAFQILSLALAVAAMLVGAHWGGPLAAIAGFSLAKAVSIVVYRLHMVHLLGATPWPLAFSIIGQGMIFVVIFRTALDMFENVGPWPEGNLLWVGMMVLAALIYAGINIVNLRSGAFSKINLK